MINFNGLIKEETKEYNPNWQEIPDDPYRMLITGGSGSVKANSKGLFQKNMKTDEIKTKSMKSKNGEKKLNEKL